MEKLITGFLHIIPMLLNDEEITDVWSNSRVLDREAASFDLQWAREHFRVKPGDFDKNTKSSLESVRKAVFLEIYRKTSSSDIAALASDDFELFISAKLKSATSNFTEWLFSEYSQGRFPAIFPERSEERIK